MASRSVIDNLPEAKRQQVIDALLAGQSLRKVANIAGVSHTQVAEYKNGMLKPALKVAEKINALQIVADSPDPSSVSPAILTKASLVAAPIISRIQQHRATVDSKMTAAGAQGAASLISADLKGLELEARLTGLLDGPQSVTVNQVAVIMMPKDEPEPAIDVHAEPVLDAIEPGETS